MDGLGCSTLAGNMNGNADSYLNEYNLERTLGVGCFAKVKLAEHIITGHKVALKKISRTPDMQEKVKREFQIQQLFMHPHIVRLYEVIETDTDIYIVMEYASSGELFDYVDNRACLNVRLSEGEARRFFQQIISGVEYCHINMVVHRDLKPENILLDSRFNVKIADFGFSNVMRDGHFLKTSCGSPHYAAPEVISGNHYAGPEVDVWSCGVILYVLLCGACPFDDENFSHLSKKIKGGIYTLPSHLSTGAKDLIRQMLLVDPLKRVTIPEIKQHPWFQCHLPHYLSVQPLHTSQQAKRVDNDIVNEVVRMGFDRNQLVSALCNRVQNKATVIYYLILDNRGLFSNGYLTSEAFELRMDNPQLSHHGSYAPRMQERLARFQTEKNWALGLQSSAHPREIMAEVLKALQELAVSWKKIGHYNMKCSWFPPAAKDKRDEFFIPHNTQLNSRLSQDSGLSHRIITKSENKVVKFEVQLYKTQEAKYLLDLQCVQGSYFFFMDLCALFLAELHVV